MLRRFAQIFLIVAGVGIFTGLVIAGQQKSDSVGDGRGSGNGSGNGVTTETERVQQEQFPYQEITIPFLRNREYISNLSELEGYQRSSSYDSFLTSYDSDNLKINGLLTRPNGQMPEGGWPAIVFVHGFIPPEQYQTESRYEAFINYLARNGFVVFKIDLRGHGDSEGEVGGAYYSADYIIDTLNARAALASSDFVNPAKIGLWGHSMAGNVVLRSMAVRPEIPAAVVWAGAVLSYEDFSEFGISDSSYRPPGDASTRQRRRQELFDTYGQFDSQSQFWSQVDPSDYLSEIQGAIQIHHAVNDDVVDVGYSRNFNSRLDQTDVPHEFYEYSSGGHNISGSSFSSAMSRTVDFFNQQLAD